MQTQVVYPKSGAVRGSSPALSDQDPLLDNLADNGGPTPTHALGAGSPAIDAGNPAGCTDELGAVISTDQRGEARVANARCDIGAYEAAP